MKSGVAQNIKSARWRGSALASLLRGRRGGCRRTPQIQLSVVQGSRDAAAVQNKNVPRETFAEREIYFNKSI